MFAAHVTQLNVPPWSCLLVACPSNISNSVFSFWVYMKLMRKVINDMLATHPKKSEESVKTHFVLVGVEVHYVSNPPR
jgi:hypothetical protein